MHSDSEDYGHIQVVPHTLQLTLLQLSYLPDTTQFYRLTIHNDKKKHYYLDEYEELGILLPNLTHVTLHGSYPLFNWLRFDQLLRLECRFNHQEQADMESLKYMTQLQHLTILNLKHLDPSLLTYLENLQVLKLCSVDMENESEWLYFWKTSSGLLKQLTKLSLEFCKSMSIECIDALIHSCPLIPKLESLKLESITNVSFHSIIPLIELAKNLKYLKLDSLTIRNPYFIVRLFNLIIESCRDLEQLVIELPYTYMFDTRCERIATFIPQKLSNVHTHLYTAMLPGCGIMNDYNNVKRHKTLVSFLTNK